MSDYTPSLGEIREEYVAINTRNHDEFMTGVSLADLQAKYDAQFDRALAAHDAEVLHRAALFLRGSENPRQADNTMQSVRHSMDDAGYELLQLSKRTADGAGLIAEKPEPMRVVDERDPECVKEWPDCREDDFNPACCRFPKACRAGYVRVVPVKQEDQTTNHEIRRQP